MKMLGIVAVGVVRESRKFSGHTYVGRVHVRHAALIIQVSYQGPTHMYTCITYKHPVVAVEAASSYVEVTLPRSHMSSTEV